MRRKYEYRIVNCLQCGTTFRLTPADLEEDVSDVDHRYCSEECEKISRDIDAAEIRREEREDG